MNNRSTLNSQQLFAKAQQCIPGGVNSPVRAFKSVGGTPLFIEKAQGAYMWDADGNQYIDYVGSWGPMIVGHAHPRIVEAVTLAAVNGMSYGAPTSAEVELAEKICQLMPSIDMVRMTSSGTEACMSAIRLARGFTQRDKIVKFEGCYHGHADSLLVKSGSGMLTLGVPTSLGVPQDVVKHTITLPYNDCDALSACFKQWGSDIACVILEPVAGNMNLVLPTADFLHSLRQLCDDYGSVLIADEVMTGFRVALGGAQAAFNLRADLTTLGKIIGAGMPVGAFGGRKDIMECIAPLGGVYQAGTLSGNPLAMRAGLAMLSLIEAEGFYEQLAQNLDTLLKGLEKAAQQVNIAFKAQQAGAMFGIYFTDHHDLSSYAAVTACNIDAFKAFFHGMLQHGVYLAPSAFEAGFISSAHTPTDIQHTLAAAETVFAHMARSGFTRA